MPKAFHKQRKGPARQPFLPVFDRLARLIRCGVHVRNHVCSRRATAAPGTAARAASSRVVGMAVAHAVTPEPMDGPSGPEGNEQQDHNSRQVEFHSQKHGWAFLSADARQAQTLAEDYLHPIPKRAGTPPCGGVPHVRFTKSAHLLGTRSHELTIEDSQRATSSDRQPWAWEPGGRSGTALPPR